MARSPADPNDSAGAGAPASALDLVGAGAEPGRPDPDAARSALDSADLAREGDGGAGELEPADGTAPAGGRDRRRRALDRRARKGGHKPTKQELEREVRELRQQLEAAQPAAVEVMQTQAAQLAPALGATFLTVFAMLARRRGAHWKLGGEEREILAQHWAVCLAPYMKDAGPYVPWAAAVMVTWGVVESRVERDARPLAAA